MLTEGSPSVRDCFAIEMIEPLSSDSEQTERSYPGVESVLGPLARKELAKMRGWGRRYTAMNAAIGRINKQQRQAVLEGVGVDENMARVIAEPSAWSRLSERRKDQIYRALRTDWEYLTGQAKSLTIAGPRDTGFEVLRGAPTRERS
jgi:hypothetical protein